MMSRWNRTKARRFSVGAASDVGRVRSENQDAYAFFELPHGRRGHGALGIVADGMGGHEGGREASRIAIEEFRRVFEESVPGRTLDDALSEAFRSANLRIFENGRSDGVHRPMGTTCTVLVIEDGRVRTGHVGDTRAYRVADSGIDQLTHDHTLAEELYRQGAITADEVATHPRRNTLTRAVGVDRMVEPDVTEATPMAPGDRYVLCSDGLRLVSSEEIFETVRSHEPQEASERLVSLANERGGPDNVTVLIVGMAP